MIKALLILFFMGLTSSLAAQDDFFLPLTDFLELNPKEINEESLFYKLTSSISLDMSNKVDKQLLVDSICSKLKDDDCKVKLLETFLAIEAGRLDNAFDNLTAFVNVNKCMESFSPYVYYLFGVYYLERVELGKARTKFYKAYSQIDGLKISEGRLKSDIEFLLGLVHVKMGELELANVWLEKARSGFLENENFIGSCLSSIMLLNYDAIRLGVPEKEICSELLNTVLEFREKIPSTSPLLFYIDEFEMSLRSQLDRNDSRIVELMKMNFDRAQFYDNHDFMVVTCKQLEYFYKNKRQYDSAYFYLKFKDSLSVLINHKEVNSALFRAEKSLVVKDKEIKLLEVKSRNRQFRYTISILIVLFLVIALMLILTIKKYRERIGHKIMQIRDQLNEIEVRKTEITRKDEKLKYLRAKAFRRYGESNDNLQLLDFLNQHSFSHKNGIISFIDRFESIYPDYFLYLSEKVDALTLNEKIITIMIVLGVSSTAQAKKMGISMSSLRTARYRLKSKINMSKEDITLGDFILSEFKSYLLNI